MMGGQEEENKTWRDEEMADQEEENKRWRDERWRGR